MISLDFWYVRHDLPLRGINFEPYRAIKMPTPDGVGISMVHTPLCKITSIMYNKGPVDKDKI